jgi:hypothetical protein
VGDQPELNPKSEGSTMNQPLLSRRDVLCAAAFTAAGALLGILASPWVLGAGARSPATHLVRAPSNADPEEQGLRPSSALSLTALQGAALRSSQSGQPLADELAYLGGINRIRGFVVEPNGDVVLLGDRDSAVPRIHIDDLVVALRNAYEVGVAYHGVPGVSIDPDPEAKDPWRLQKVRVFGMPPSQMTARMVALDYQLKKVSGGLLRLANVPGLYELRRATHGLCDDERAADRKAEVRLRFWFYPLSPERPRFREDRGIVLIVRPVGAQLLTEQQFFSRTGQQTRSAPAPPEAEEFVRLVTQRLLATNEVPRYAALRNDFRVIEVAKLLRFKAVAADHLRYFLQDHELQAVSVPAYVGGIRREERGEATCDATVTEQRMQASKVLHLNERVSRHHYSSRGGVEAKVQLSSEEFVPEHSGRLAQLRARARASRPSADAVVWPIQYPDRA